MRGIYKITSEVDIEKKIRGSIIAQETLKKRTYHKKSFVELGYDNKYSQIEKYLYVINEYNLTFV